MANNRNYACIDTRWSSKGSPWGVRESVALETHIRGYFSALSSSALPEHLQMQEIQSFPRPASLPVSSFRTKSEARQVSSARKH